MPDISVGKDKQFAFDCHGTVDVVKFCQMEFLTDLLAIGTGAGGLSSVVIVRCTLQEEKNVIRGIQFDEVAEFRHGVRVVDICWSLHTDLHSIPRCLALFTAGSDRKVRFLKSDLKSDTAINVIGEHKDHVNAVAGCAVSGDQVVSVSDDHTCCIWSVNEPLQYVACFPLTSPGMAVCWHTKETGKLLVAEKKGILRMYSAVTLQAFMSLDCGHTPLVSADWSPTNELRVAALAGSDWFIFDTSRSRTTDSHVSLLTLSRRLIHLLPLISASSHQHFHPSVKSLIYPLPQILPIVDLSTRLASITRRWPLESKQAHSDGGRLVSWSRSHDHMLATTGRPAAQLKVFNIRTNQVAFSAQLKLTSGLSWHSDVSVLAVGSDRQVLLFVIDSLS